LWSVNTAGGQAQKPHRLGRQQKKKRKKKKRQPRTTQKTHPADRGRKKTERKKKGVKKLTKKPEHPRSPRNKGGERATKERTRNQGEGGKCKHVWKNGKLQKTAARKRRPRMKSPVRREHHNPARTNRGGIGGVWRSLIR